MAQKSQWLIPCPACGHTEPSNSPSTRCSECGRPLEIGEWAGRDHQAIEAAKIAIMQAMGDELMKNGPMPPLLFHLDYTVLACLIGCLELSLRHPNNNGFAADQARRFIAGCVERLRSAGWNAHADLLEKSREPLWDVATVPTQGPNQ